MKLNGVLSLMNFPSDDPEKSRDFFGKLLGIDLVPSLAEEESYHAPISQDGIDLNVTKRHVPQEGVTPFFGVENLPNAVSTAKQMGAKVVWGPANLSIPAADFPHYKEGIANVDGVQVTSPEARFCRYRRRARRRPGGLGPSCRTR